MAWFYRWAQLFLRIIPYKFATVVLAKKVASLTYYTYYHKRKASVVANLTKVYKRIKKSEVRKIVFSTYVNFARLIYEFIMLPNIVNRENYLKHVTLMHKERFDEAMSKEKGVIVLTAHLGNWELGAGILGALGYSPTAIALPQQARYTRNFFTNRRKSVGVKTVYITGGLLKPVLLALKNGNVVATLGDRRYSGHSIRENFFGSPLEFPAGTFTLAEHTGAPIVPAFCVKENTRSDKYVIYFEPELTGGVKEWSKILERYVKKYITQWFVFDKLWP